MKIVFQDLKKGEVKIEVNSLEDLWFLSHIIEESDEVSGKTIRKIKLGDDSDKNTKIIKKPVTLKIKVEKVEFHKFANELRVSGKILEGPDDVPHGSYHTFELEQGTVVKIIKPSWPMFQIQRLKEACEEKSGKVLIVAMDRDQVTYALLTTSGYTILAELEGEVGKKGYADIQEKDFYEEVAKHMEEYTKRYEAENIILASPAFWKENLLTIIKKKHSSIAKKITLATCNTTGKNAIEEILRREEVKTVLKKDRTSRESILVEDLFAEIAKQGNVSYGFKEVQLAANAHAIKVLLVTDVFLQEQRRQAKYNEIDLIMKDVDHAKGEVHIISNEHDAGKKLQGLGGIAAILRYKLK